MVIRYSPPAYEQAVTGQLLAGAKMTGAQQKALEQQMEMQKRQWGFAREQAGAAGTAMTQLTGEYNRAYQEAKSANEARYQQMLGITSETTGQRGADIRAAYAGQEANLMQTLSRQGMAGTTVAPTMKQGLVRERESALNRLADQMQQTKLGIIERREDKYPDLGLITSLAGLYGQGLGGSGGGGAAGAGGMSQLISGLGNLRMG